MNVQDIIKSVAAKYKLPDWLLLTIAKTESGFNPYNIGDNGTSFGLFQLHRGGLAPDNLSSQQLFDPETNATIAAQNMVSNYQSAISQGLSGFDLVQYVANNSGWPTQAGTSATPADYNQKLAAAYSSVTGSSSGNWWDKFNAWMSDPSHKISWLDLGQDRQKILHEKPGTTYGLPFAKNDTQGNPVPGSIWTTSFWTGIVSKAGGFILGVVLIILGFILLMKGDTSE